MNTSFDKCMCLYIPSPYSVFLFSLSKILNHVAFCLSNHLTSICSRRCTCLFRKPFYRKWICVLSRHHAIVLRAGFMRCCGQVVAKRRLYAHFNSRKMKAWSEGNALEWEKSGDTETECMRVIKPCRKLAFFPAQCILVPLSTPTSVSQNSKQPGNFQWVGSGHKKKGQK